MRPWGDWRNGPPSRRATAVIAALAGLSLAFSFPRTDWWFLAWVGGALISLCLLRAGSWRVALGCGLLAGVIQSGLNLTWIPTVMSEFGGLPAWGAWILLLPLLLLLALFPAAACAGTFMVMKRRGRGYVLLLPAAWVSMEFLLCFVPFGGFPWLLVGYSQTSRLVLIQIADVAGVFGVSFLVLWTGAAAAWFATCRRGLRGWWPLLLSCAMLVGCLAYGGRALNRWRCVVPTHTAAMIQGNLSIREDWAVLRQRYGEGYVRTVESLDDRGVDLLILPESPSPLTYQYDGAYRDRMRQLARRFRLGMIFNNISYIDGGMGGGYCNSAYFLDSNGNDLGRYDKMRLVPFGEYIPLRQLFSFAETITKDVSSFQPGSLPLVVPIGPGRASAMICYEAVFPRLARRFVEQGASLLVNLTNDAWYGDSAAPHQHLAISRWRAIENRRFLLRAANSGISACIAPTGQMTGVTPLLQPAVSTTQYAFLGHTTVYAWAGDWFAVACAIIFAYFLCGSFAARRRR